MNTLTDKLNAIEDTKTAIREAIESKGTSVPLDTPFRQYASYIGDTKTGMSLRTYADQDAGIRTTDQLTNGNAIVTIDDTAGKIWNLAGLMQNIWNFREDQDVVSLVNSKFTKLQRISNLQFVTPPLSIVETKQGTGLSLLQRGLLGPIEKSYYKFKANKASFNNVEFGFDPNHRDGKATTGTGKGLLKQAFGSNVVSEVAFNNVTFNKNEDLYFMFTTSKREVMRGGETYYERPFNTIKHIIFKNTKFIGTKEASNALYDMGSLIDFSFDSSNSFDDSLTSIDTMFSNCPELKSVDLSGIPTKNLTGTIKPFDSNEPFNQGPYNPEMDITFENNCFSNEGATVVDISNIIISSKSRGDLARSLAQRNNKPTLKLNRGGYASLTPEELQMITDKGWNVTA